MQRAVKPSTSLGTAAAADVNAKRPVERRPELDTDLDDGECGRASEIANRDRAPAYVFPCEVRPPKGSKCFGR
jgi:hypothetical protein